MAGYSKLILTNEGEKLVSKAVVDNPIEITKFVFGEGIWQNESEIKTAKQLKAPKLVRPPAGLEYQNNHVLIIGVLSNETNEESFYLREIGVYAKLYKQQDSESILLGISYGNEGVDYIPKHDEAYVELTFKFILKLTDKNAVTINLNTIDFRQAIMRTAIMSFWFTGF